MRDPSPRLTAEYAELRAAAERAAHQGDRSGAAYASQEARRIFRRIRKQAAR